MYFSVICFNLGRWQRYNRDYGKARDSAAHTLQSWYDRLPKIELHLHLEGAIPLPVLWELVQKYGGDPLLPDQAALQRKFEYKDFPHFIDTWIWKNQFLCEYEDFTFLAEAVARHLAAQNIRYVEAFYSPSDFFRRGLSLQRLTEAIRIGLDAFRRSKSH